MSETAFPNFGKTYKDLRPGEAEIWRAWLPVEGEPLRVPAPKRDGYIVIVYPEVYLAVQYPSHTKYFVLPDTVAFQKKCNEAGGQGVDFFLDLKKQGLI